jgi:hypothetical protein
VYKNSLPFQYLIVKFRNSALICRIYRLCAGEESEGGTSSEKRRRRRKKNKNQKEKECREGE